MTYSLLILVHIHRHTHTHTHTQTHIIDDQHRVDPPDIVNLELQNCGAYEVVQLSKQRVTMNDNPAYGEVGVGEYFIIT